MSTTEQNTTLHFIPACSGFTGHTKITEENPCVSNPTKQPEYFPV